MASMARRLLAAPLSAFDGNAFYPYGKSLAFSEPLLIPSLLGLPGFLWGNPVLTYNLLLLALWPLNGVALAWVAHRLTGSRPAAWLAGAVFCLSPYFTEYHVEFQMLLAAVVPVVLFAWVRWLETAAPRWLGLALAGLAVQGMTTWYYTIILGLALVALTLGVACLRWHGWAWRARLGRLAGGSAALALVLLPVAWPYVVVYRELGFERGISDTAAHSADLFTFLEPGTRSLFYRVAPGGHVAETSTFAGITVLVLAAASAVWLRRPAGWPLPAPRLGRLLAVVLVVALGVALALLFWPFPRHRLGRLVIHPRAAELLDLAVVCGVALLLRRGWAAHRAGAPRRLGRGDWVRLLSLLTGLFAVLALGPVLHVGTKGVAPGPYLSLYHVLLPLHAVRITTRFAVIALAGLGLLAALGLRAIEVRLRAHPGRRRLVLAALFLALGLEYAVMPIAYAPVDGAGRPVDRVLRAEPGEAALLEWPTNVDDSDADAMFRSLVHEKHVVNGVSGFVPDSLRTLSGLLTTPGAPFPVPEAQAELRRIYPLRYLVVRLGDPLFPPGWQPIWRGLRETAPPLLRFRGTFGTDDLYEVVSLPEAGTRIERLVSSDILRRHPVLELDLRPLVSGEDVEQWVEVGLDARPIERIRLPGPVRPRVRLWPPYHEAAPHAIRLVHGYGRPPAARDSRYRIGQTGVLSPGDLRVESWGGPERGAGSIRFNDVELSLNRRGYNLVALDPEGRLVASGRFDTFLDPGASARLAAWVAALPPGSIVAGAVRDEASERLTAEAVQALGTLGVTGDLRGRFRQAHGFVGVRGAPLGTALEDIGPGPVAVVVGRVEPGLGLELRAFTLTAARDPA